MLVVPSAVSSAGAASVVKSAQNARSDRAAVADEGRGSPAPQDAAHSSAPVVPDEAVAPGSNARLELSGSEPVETEVAYLRKAQDALAANPTLALTLVQDHARRYPKGGLSQECEVIAVTALMRLGRAGDARQRAAAFSVRFPNSAHVRRVETIVE